MYQLKLLEWAAQSRAKSLHFSNPIVIFVTIVRERFYCIFYMYRKLFHQSCKKKGSFSIDSICMPYENDIICTHDEIFQTFSVLFFGPILFKTGRKCKFRVYFLGHESTLNPILSFSFFLANFTNWKASSRTFASEILILFTILWFWGKFLDNVLGDFTGLFGWFFTIFNYVV